MFGNSLVKTSRNCSSFRATFRTSFSLALPIMKKFLVRTLTQVSFADTGECCETRARKQRATARGKTKRFILLAKITATPAGRLLLNAYYADPILPDQCSLDHVGRESFG